MSIPYKEIRKIVRFKLKDNNEALFSDYEIKLAVNEVIRYLSISQSLNNSDFLNKELTFDAEKDGIDYSRYGIELPDDFVTLVGVRDYRGLLLEPCDTMLVPMRWQYKISNNMLFSGAKTFTMMYKAELQEVTDDESEIALPNLFKDSIVQLSLMIINQVESDVMHSAADTAIEQIIPKRKFRNAHIKLPFTIGGRRC